MDIIKVQTIQKYTRGYLSRRRYDDGDGDEYNYYKCIKEFLEGIERVEKLNRDYIEFKKNIK